MRAILTNPYRIIGLPINASRREVLANIGMLKAFTFVKKYKSFSTDAENVLAPPIRSVNSVNRAETALQSPDERLKAAMTWFAITSERDVKFIDDFNRGTSRICSDLTCYSSVLNSAVSGLIKGKIGVAIDYYVKLFYDNSLRLDFLSSVYDLDINTSPEHLSMKLTSVLASHYTFDMLAPAYSAAKSISNNVLAVLIDYEYGKIQTELDKEIGIARNVSPQLSGDVLLPFINRSKALLEKASNVMVDSNKTGYMRDIIAQTVLKLSVNGYNSGFIPAKNAISSLRFATNTAASGVVKLQCKHNYDLLLNNL